MLIRLVSNPLTILSMVELRYDSEDDVLVHTGSFPRKGTYFRISHSRILKCPIHIALRKSVMEL